MNHSKYKKGFTLIELLVVIAIIGILTVVVFVALDPSTRLRNARDAVRQNDVQEILSAIKLHQIDNDGNYLASIAGMTAGQVYMIVDGAAMAAGCDDNNDSCDTDVSGDTNCVNLAGLVDQYLNDVSVSPSGAVTWDDGDTAGEEGTGYTLERDAQGVVRVRACESEQGSEIMASK